MTRYKAYSWLSNKMNLPGKDAHIALFEVEQCKKVIELSKKEIEGIRKNENENISKQIWKQKDKC